SALVVPSALVVFTIVPFVIEPPWNCHDPIALVKVNVSVLSIVRAPVRLTVPAMRVQLPSFNPARVNAPPRIKVPLSSSILLVLLQLLPEIVRVPPVVPVSGTGAADHVPVLVHLPEFRVIVPT